MDSLFAGWWLLRELGPYKNVTYEGSWFLPGHIDISTNKTRLQRGKAEQKESWALSGQGGCRPEAAEFAEDSRSAAPS